MSDLEGCEGGETAGVFSFWRRATDARLTCFGITCIIKLGTSAAIGALMSKGLCLWGFWMLSPARVTKRGSKEAYVVLKSLRPPRGFCFQNALRYTVGVLTEDPHL